MTLNKNNSNKESLADVMTIQIALLLTPYLPTIAYRIIVKLLSVWSTSYQRHDLILNSLTHSPTITTNIISIKRDSYRLKKYYIAEISRSFIVRSPKALIVRRNYKELISQLLKKSDSSYFNLVITTYNREYKFVIYRVIIFTSREISNLSKASIKI